MLFVQFFDALVTLMPLGRLCGSIDEDNDKPDEGMEKAFLCDALGGVIGSICGTSTLTAYSESAIGIGLGGRTGLTAVVTGLLFLLSIFFAPLVLSLFTSSVTVCELIIVGVMMIVQIKDIDWDNLVVSASAFMTMLMMILTYSISLGIAWGFVTYVTCTIASNDWKNLNWRSWVLYIIFIGTSSLDYRNCI